MSLSVFAAARETADHAAVIAGGEARSWAELAESVRPIVAALRGRSLTGPASVGFVAANDLATFETLHALVALGTPAFPIHPRLSAAERDALVAAVAPAAVVEPGRLGGPEPGRVPASLPAGPDRPDTRAGPAAGTPDPPTPPADDRPLAIVHTSGTTGQPRGVVLSRRAFTASARASATNLGWREDDRWLLPLPMAHIGGLSIVTRCLLARRTVVLAPGSDPEELLESVRRHRVTLLSVVPTVLRRLLETGRGPPDHLRAVLVGGAAASADLLDRAAQRGWPVLATYGLTEACSQVATQRYRGRTRGEAGCGPPLPGLEVRIGADDTILVRGETLFSGYRPAGDQPPLLPGGWLDTGDRGRLDEDGNLHVLGRRSDRIVTGGENVDPAEVERALEGLPGVAEACVFGIPDEEWGELVCAALVTGADASGQVPEELARGVRALSQRLASFKRPRRIALLDALPRNATGKVDRRETARRAAGRLRPL